MVLNKTLKVLAFTLLVVIISPFFVSLSSAAESKPQIDMPRSILEGDSFDVTVSATHDSGIKSLALYYDQDGDGVKEWVTRPAIMEPTSASKTFEDIIEYKGSQVISYKAKVEFGNGMILVNTEYLEVRESLTLTVNGPTSAEPNEKYSIIATASDNIGLSSIAILPPDGGWITRPCIMNPQSDQKTFTFSQDEEGSYKYLVRATDVDGHIDDEFISIYVGEGSIPGAPTITKFVAEYDEDNNRAPLDVLFKISANDEDGYIVKYELDFDDGTMPATKSDEDGIDMNDIEFSYKYKKGGTYAATLTVTDNDGLKSKPKSVTISVAYYYHEDHGGGSGDSGGYGGGYDGGYYDYGLADGRLILDQKTITLDAGESTKLAIEVMNTGSSEARFELELESASFGSASVSPSKFNLGSGEDMRSYITLKADSDAEGQYILKVNLLQDGRVIDSAKIYVKVEDSTSTWELFGTIALLIISFAGVAGLAYLVYKNYNKKKENNAQVELKKYY